MKAFAVKAKKLVRSSASNSRNSSRVSVSSARYDDENHDEIPEHSSVMRTWTKKDLIKPGVSDTIRVYVESGIGGNTVEGRARYYTYVVNRDTTAADLIKRITAKLELSNFSSQFTLKIQTPSVRRKLENNESVLAIQHEWLDTKQWRRGWRTHRFVFCMDDVVRARMAQQLVKRRLADEPATTLRVSAGEPVSEEDALKLAIERSKRTAAEEERLRREEEEQLREALRQSEAEAAEMAGGHVDEERVRSRTEESIGSFLDYLCDTAGESVSRHNTLTEVDAWRNLNSAMTMIIHRTQSGLTVEDEVEQSDVVEFKFNETGTTKIKRGDDADDGGDALTHTPNSPQYCDVGLVVPPTLQKGELLACRVRLDPDTGHFWAVSVSDRAPDAVIYLAPDRLGEASADDYATVQLDRPRDNGKLSGRVVGLIYDVVEAPPPQAASALSNSQRMGTREFEEQARQEIEKALADL